MDIKSILGTVAPWIGAALGGPFGGMAAEFVADKLGLSDKTVEGVKNMLNGASSEQILALKKADQDFSLKMKELGFEEIKALESIAADDRKDARAMQVRTRSIVPAVLSIGVTIGYFGILIGMMQGTLKVSDSQALLIMLGSLTTAWGGVVAYWFGTTNSSNTKTEMLSKAAPIK